MGNRESLADLLVRCAQAEGFPLAGALDLDLAFSAPEASFSDHLARYDRWLAAGRAGAMSYLERGRDRRADPRLVFPEAQSILCVAIPYERRPAGAASLHEGPRYARYLQSRDYHAGIAEGIERALKRAQAEGPYPELRWKTCVDTSAVLERTWAALAGLGWIGKNTMLIHPRHGSYLFLGEALLNLPTGRGPSPLRDYCGRCTRCLDACPTKAFPEPNVLDANRCISYWTLEKRGSLELTHEDREAIGPWIAGCDLCQEACPFNRKPARLASPEETRLDGDATEARDWIALLEEDETSFRTRVRDSALSRVKPAQFRRNLAIALANAADHLADSERQRLRALVSARLAAESDEAASTEWQRCLTRI